MADQQDSEADSELLRVLGQLGDAAWADTLLPLLRANKSAGAVALASKQLRRLCHGNQRELKLTGANCQHLGLLELDAFSRPFPACSSVVFTASSTDDLAYRLTSVVPLLARLHKLQSLQLNISSSTGSQPAHVAPALQLLRLQLPQLRSLQVELDRNWHSASEEAWKMLGAATQLTKLAIDFNDNAAGYDDPGLSLQHLSALQPLGRGLQHLELTAAIINDDPTEDCSFLSSFSGLTSLELPVISKRSGLAAISSCTALQDLQFGSCGSPVLDAAECAALAQLTRLTLLEIPPSSDTQALLAALRCLSGLQTLRLGDMSSSHLPVLASLTKLTTLRGIWVDTPTDQATLSAVGASQHICPSVVEVFVSGPFPLAAFPGAKHISVIGTWQPSRLASVGQHMKTLKVLTISGSATTSTFRSLDPSAPEAERVAAVRSLGQLAQLTRLQFALNDDAEAAALAAACRRVSMLWLGVPHGSRVTALGLASGLCNVSLHELAVVLYGLQLSQSEARLLLAGWSGVRQLYVGTETPEQQQVWEAAAAAARAAGLPLPPAFEVYVD